MTVIARFPCPALGGEVELTAERLGHMLGGHPELERGARPLTEMLASVCEAPAKVVPDEIDPNELQLIRWIPDILGGKYLVAVVIADPARNWFISAYLARRLTRRQQAHD